MISKNMFPIAFAALTLFTLSAYAMDEVREIELSKCYIASKPVLRPSVRSSEGLGVSYSYNIQTEVLIIVTDNYGAVVSEKVYKKVAPVLERFDDSDVSYSIYTQDIPRFEADAFNYFTQKYEMLSHSFCK